MLQLLDAHHAAEVALGLGLAFGFAKALAEGGSLLGRGILAGHVLGIDVERIPRRVLGLVLDEILGQILGSLIFIVVTLEQCHGDQILYLARM